MPSPLHLLSFSFVFLSIFFQTHTLDEVEMHTCAPFSCGNFTNIRYPFWNLRTQPDFCGHPKFKLDCRGGTLTLEVKSQRFIILQINQTSRLLRIARTDLYDALTINSCPLQYSDVEVDLNFFHYTSNDANYTLLSECGPIPDPPSSNLTSEVYEITTCHKDDKLHFSYLVLTTMVIDFNVLECKKSASVPGLNISFTSMTDTLEKGFEVGWSGVGEDICDGCIKSGEMCGFNKSENAAICLSPKKSASSSMPVAQTSNGTWNLKRKVIVGAVSSTLGTFAVMLAIKF